MAGKKPADRSRGRSSGAAPRGRHARRTILVKHGPKAPSLKLDLAIEALTQLLMALREFGLKPRELAQAIRKASRLKQVPTVSGRIASDNNRLGTLLSRWSRERTYLDADGRPRVLPIRGAGVSFETLVREVFPDRDLDKILAFALATAEVAVRPGNKIALLGSILVNVTDSDERHLAHMIRQLDQVVNTNCFNRRAMKRGEPGRRLERLTTGIISAGQVASFRRELTPQIYELLLGVESSMDRRAPKTAGDRKAAKAVAVGMYVSEDEDLERAGWGGGLRELHKTRKGH